MNDAKRTTANGARNDVFWAVWSVVAAFGTYFCMYFYRKPFTAETFKEDVAFGFGLKGVLVISQMLGYMLSKFIGHVSPSEETLKSVGSQVCMPRL